MSSNLKPKITAVCVCSGPLGEHEPGCSFLESDALRAENERLRAGINLHKHDGYVGCTECSKAWPCPTIASTAPGPQPL